MMSRTAVAMRSSRSWINGYSLFLRDQTAGKRLGDGVDFKTRVSQIAAQYRALSPEEKLTLKRRARKESIIGATTRKPHSRRTWRDRAPSTSAPDVKRLSKYALFIRREMRGAVLHRSRHDFKSFIKYLRNRYDYLSPIQLNKLEQMNKDMKAYKRKLNADQPRRKPRSSVSGGTPRVPRGHGTRFAAFARERFSLYPPEISRASRLEHLARMYALRYNVTLTPPKVTRTPLTGTIDEDEQHDRAR